MNDKSYRALAGFLQKESGLVLGDNKSYLVDSRLTPVAQQHGYASIAQLVNGLEGASPTIREAVVDAMTTNESFFFRDMVPFKQFEDIMLPALVSARRPGGKITIWCAAASTGQEPYSLAMIVKSKSALLRGINVEIIATDISENALNQARAGRYTQFEVQRGLPVQMLVEHFVQDGTSWVISDDIKNMVRYSRRNLLAPLYGMPEVDIVFCRNVLIYFDVPTKTRAIEAIHKVSRPDAYLVLGAAETLMGVSTLFERVGEGRGIYQPVLEEGQRLRA